MLDVTKTAAHGIAISIPAVVTRKAAPYLAIAAKGMMHELPQFAPPRFAALHAWMHGKGIEPQSGVFRYKRFGADGSVELDVATQTHHAQTGGGEVIAGELPAGRYATATYTGPYDRLYDAFSMLNGWVEARGLSVAGAPGAPQCQAEIYRVSPAQTGDAAKWETDLLLKLADG